MAPTGASSTTRQDEPPSVPGHEVSRCQHRALSEKQVPASGGGSREDDFPVGVSTFAESPWQGSSRASSSGGLWSAGRARAGWLPPHVQVALEQVGPPTVQRHEASSTAHKATVCHWPSVGSPVSLWDLLNGQQWLQRNPDCLVLELPVAPWVCHF